MKGRPLDTPNAKVIQDAEDEFFGFQRNGMVVGQPPPLPPAPPVLGTSPTAPGSVDHL